MENRRKLLEKLLLEAEDCELIARLAVDRSKKLTFFRIAEQFRAMAADLRADIAANSIDLDQATRSPNHTRSLYESPAR